MTVDTAGEVQLSAKLTGEGRVALGLNGCELKVAALRAEHHLYLGFHRQHVWAG